MTQSTEKSSSKGLGVDQEGSTARTKAPAPSPLTREEVAAIWLFPEDYAAQREHARIWYRELSDHARRSVGQFLWALDEAAR